MSMTYSYDEANHKLTVKGDGLKDIVVDLGNTAFTVWQDTDRYLEVREGGGHWETSALGGVSDHAGGFETADGHLLIHNL